MTIMRVPFAVVQTFARAAARERVSLTDTRQTEWYGVAWPDGAIGGVVGLLKVPWGYRIKGLYVTPERRGQGAARLLLNAALSTCAMVGAGVEVLTYHPPAYVTRGFEACGTRPNGAVLMRRRP